MRKHMTDFLTAKERRERKRGFSRFYLRSLMASILLFGISNANAADWVKAYKKGDYTNAFQALETMTNNFPDIGNYNRGNVLYRQKNFQGSEKAYSEAAALTKNDSLKQQALYNRGTALLAGTTTQTDPSKIDEKITAATQAVSLFEQALTIKPDDMDAKQNLERALKLKERLEKQKEQKKQDQQKQDQKNQDQQQKKDQNKQDQQQKQDQQNQDQQKNSQGQQDQNKDQQPQDRQQQPDQPKQAGEMSPEEAQQLLDAMKQDEQDQRANLKPFLGGPVRVDKDW